MEIYIIKKYKYRIYKSDEIVQHIFHETLIHDEKGAPKIKNRCISISDTSNYWVCAVSDKPVGIDCEWALRKVKAEVSKRLHPVEQAYLKPLSPQSSEWREEFLNVWVRKEAFMKLEGEGLRMGLSSFSVIDISQLSSEAVSELSSSEYRFAPVRAFSYKDLIIGLAGDCEEYSIRETEYDAPFEKNVSTAAMELLNSRMYSREELAKKLAEKGYGEDEINGALNQLCEKKYIDDGYYAKQLAKRYFDAGKAPFGIETELIKKGIPKDVAHEAAAEYEESAYDKAFEIASKYEIKTPKDEAKICRKLASYGYKQSIVYDIIIRLKL